MRCIREVELSESRFSAVDTRGLEIITLPRSTRCTLTSVRIGMGVCYICCVLFESAGEVEIDSEPRACFNHIQEFDRQRSSSGLAGFQWERGG